MPKHEEQEETGFVKLLVEHQSLLRAFVISLLPGVPEAEDVIQMTNEVLWTKRENFEMGTNFKAWALTTARFQVMALQRRLKRERRTTLDDDVLMLLSEEGEDLDSKEMTQRLADLNECVGLLQIKDQELILHRYWKKVGLEEFAKTMDRSVGALKTSLYRIRAGLRICIEQKDKGRYLST